MLAPMSITTRLRAKYAISCRAILIPGHYRIGSTRATFIDIAHTRITLALTHRPSNEHMVFATRSGQRADTRVCRG